MPRPLLLVPLLLLACGSDDGREKGTVVSVHDGDTVTLDDGRKIRYLGVDTPETDQDQCFAQEARKFNESLVLNREVTLEFDDGPAENNGRVLAYVWLSAGGADRLVSEELLRQGYGKLCVIPPAQKYEDRLRTAQNQAKASGAGVWSQCPDLGNASYCEIKN